METLIELRTLIFGNISWALWIASLLFAGIGVFINILFGALFRNKKATGSPEEFSWSFFRTDNKKRFWIALALSFLIFFVFARFFSEFTGNAISTFWALAIGLGLDFVINSFYKKRLDWIGKIFGKK